MLIILPTSSSASSASSPPFHFHSINHSLVKIDDDDASQKTHLFKPSNNNNKAFLLSFRIYIRFVAWATGSFLSMLCLHACCPQDNHVFNLPAFNFALETSSLNLYTDFTFISNFKYFPSHPSASFTRKIQPLQN